MAAKVLRLAALGAAVVGVVAIVTSFATGKTRLLVGGVPCIGIAVFDFFWLRMLRDGGFLS